MLPLIRRAVGLAGGPNLLILRARERTILMFTGWSILEEAFVDTCLLCACFGRVPQYRASRVFALNTKTGIFSAWGACPLFFAASLSSISQLVTAFQAFGPASALCFWTCEAVIATLNG